MQSTRNPPRLNDTVAARLRGTMAMREINAADLANWLGVSVQSARRRMRGRHRFTLDEVEELARLLKVDTQTLLTSDDPTSGANK